MKRIAILVICLLTIAPISEVGAQCAMCRATLENNLSNGNIGIAAGINFGILYLFVAPYLFISLLAFFWYKTSKRNASKSFNGSVAG